MTVTEPSRLRDICFDCAQPAPLARFWAAALGYGVRPYTEEDLAYLRSQGIDDPENDPSVVIEAPDSGPRIWFNRVPEAKSGKNRVHLDLNLRPGESIAWLESLGARVLHPAGSRPGTSWAVMADPEGNEFCAFPPRD